MTPAPDHGAPPGKAEAAKEAPTSTARIPGGGRLHGHQEGLPPWVAVGGRVRRGEGHLAGDLLEGAVADDESLDHAGGLEGLLLGRHPALGPPLRLGTVTVGAWPPWGGW